MQVLLHGGDLGGDIREWPEGEPSRTVFDQFVYELRPDVVGQVTTEAGAEDLRSAVLCAVVSGDDLPGRVQSARAAAASITASALGSGFVYKALRFDASPKARAEWNMIAINADTIPKPYYVTDKFGTNGLFLNTSAEIRAFYNASTSYLAACQQALAKADSAMLAADDDDDLAQALRILTQAIDALSR